MIDNGTTQVQVKAEEVSRTITILVNHDLFKDTDDVIHAFSSFCSDTEHKTLSKPNDSTLSKSIVGLALRVSFFLSHLIFDLFCLQIILSIFLFYLSLQTVILELENVWRNKRLKEIYQKLRMKYEEFRRKYKDVERRLREGGDVPTLSEELRKRDEELLSFVDKFSSLEVALKRKKEEIELSKGIKA